MLNWFANGKLTDRSIGLPTAAVVDRSFPRAVPAADGGAHHRRSLGYWITACPYYAHENAYGKDKLGAWLPFSDFDLLSGEFDDERIMEMMQKIITVQRCAADARKVF